MYRSTSRVLSRESKLDELELDGLEFDETGSDEKNGKPQRKTWEDRFLEAFEASFREQYANPERIGCVDMDILWKMVW